MLTICTSNRGAFDDSTSSFHRLWNALRTSIKNACYHAWLKFPARGRLFVYQLLIDTGLRLFGPTLSTRTFRLPFNMYAKVGLRVVEAEANVMRFVAKTTTIPVPTVLDVIPVPTGVFILMTALPGNPLFGGLKTMRTEEFNALAQDMHSVFLQLHNITAPDRRVCGFSGSSFRDFRIQYEHIGPFACEMDFYSKLRERVPLDILPHIMEISHAVHSTPHRLCLTHNDIAPQNLLVKDNRLTGVLDWECAAWLPEYWEYTRSRYLFDKLPRWFEFMDNAHPQRYPEELAVETALWRVTSPL